MPYGTPFLGGWSGQLDGVSGKFHPKPFFSSSFSSTTTISSCGTWWHVLVVWPLSQKFFISGRKISGVLQGSGDGLKGETSDGTSVGDITDIS